MLHPAVPKLGKVQPIIDKLSHRFQAVYSPGKNVSVDEAMIPFKGRSTLKQYMPLKPVKRGIKVWALADACNGYITNFQVYTGKQRDATEKGLGANVVKTLTKPYTHSFRHVFFDNFFTSLDLLDSRPAVRMWHDPHQQEGFSCSAETCGEERDEGKR